MRLVTKVLIALSLLALGPPVAAQQPRQDSDNAPYVQVRSLVDSSRKNLARPVTRYTSGLTVYEEGLHDGVWINRYWSPTGRIDLDPVTRGNPATNASFRLQLGGNWLSDTWSLVSSGNAPDPRSHGSTATVVLKHGERPLTVKVHTLVDGTAVFTRWLEIKNDGDKALALSGLDLWAGKVFPCQIGNRSWGEYSKYSTPHGDYEIGYFVENKHSSEGHFQWRALGDQPFELNETGGVSGWGHPILYLRDGKAGDLFVAQLAWSANWRMRAEKIEDGVFIAIGPYGPGNLRVLAPGETIRTPEVHFGGVRGDLDAMVRELHTHQRRSVLAPFDARRVGLISYNHWSYMGHEMDEERLLREIDIAAEAGAEVFTIDAGWYGNVGEDWHGVGLWKPGSRLPRGFERVFAHARRKGLKCGLWVWIEAASETSPIIRQHPDWLLVQDGKRLDNLLDLSKPEVAAWVEAEILRIIEEYGIDLFRLDYNRFPGKGGVHVRAGLEETTLWRHYEAMYGIWERVRKKHPNVVLENCAGGGGRTDLGMVSRFDFTWFSDYLLAPRAIRMMNGMLFALPPERLARINGVAINAHLGGDLDMQLRMNFLVGNPAFSGLWPTLEDKNPLVLKRTRHMVDIFRQHVRPLLPSSVVYHHTPVITGSHPEGWCVLEYAAPDKTKAIAGLFRLAGQAEPEYKLKFRGLARSKSYRVTLDNADETIIVSGRELVESGLTVSLRNPMSSELILVEEDRK